MMDWMRPTDDGYGPWERAGTVIRTADGGWVVNPTEGQLRGAGFLPARDEPPETDAAHVAVGVGWEERDGWAVRVYEIRERPSAPPQPRRWSRLTVKGALADARLLPAARTFLAAYEIKPDYPALEAFSDCNYIEEFYGGEDKWNQLLDSAAQALGMTRAEVDAFLDSLPEETA